MIKNNIFQYDGFIKSLLPIRLLYRGVAHLYHDSLHSPVRGCIADFLPRLHALESDLDDLLLERDAHPYRPLFVQGGIEIPFEFRILLEVGDKLAEEKQKLELAVGERWKVTRKHVVIVEPLL
jgi:hypothetical protein